MLLGALLYLVSAESELLKAAHIQKEECSFLRIDSKNVNSVGTINGEKISNTAWRIEIDVPFNGCI